MSGPAAGALAQLAVADSIRASAEAVAASRWTDAAYRTFYLRYLRVVQTETTRFGAALSALDVALGRALSLIA